MFAQEFIDEPEMKCLIDWKMEEFNKCPSDNRSIPCPICGTKSTQPMPGCSCRSEFSYHAMKYHHKCKKERV